MKNIIKKKLIFNVILSILGVVGIVLIPVGFSLDITCVGIIGIAILVFCFYGLPFFWLNFTSTLSMKKVYDAINRERLYTVEEI